MLAWATDDTGYIVAAMQEWNFRQEAWIKPADSFGQLPIDGQSWVLRRAAELKSGNNSRACTENVQVGRP